MPLIMSLTSRGCRRLPVCAVEIVPVTLWRRLVKDMHRQPMPMSLRLSLLFALVAILGLLLMVHAHVISGWNAMASFAKGLVVAGVGLSGTLLLAGFSMIKKGPWRRFALIEVLLALVFVVCVGVLWALA